MKEKCFVDSSVVYSVVVNGKTDLLRKLSYFVLYTSVNVLEEVSFKIVVDSVLEDQDGDAGFYRVKDMFERGVAESTIERRLHVLNFIASRVNVLSPKLEDFELAKRLIIKQTPVE